MASNFPFSAVARFVNASRNTESRAGRERGRFVSPISTLPERRRASGEMALLHKLKTNSIKGAQSPAGIDFK